MCASTGISLTYKVESDVTRGGPTSEGPCHTSFTYFADPPTGRRQVPIEKDYNYRMTVTDVGRTPSQSAVKEGTVAALP
jgi:hypothetical protein